MRCCPLAEPDECFAHTDSAMADAAQRPGKCCECSMPIASGMYWVDACSYREASYECEDTEKTEEEYIDDTEEFSTCLVCREIRMHFQCGGWTYGSLWEELEENFYPDMTCGGPCMSGLSPEARGRLIDGRLEWLADQEEMAVSIPPWMEPMRERLMLDGYLAPRLSRCGPDEPVRRPGSQVCGEPADD